MTNHKVSIKEMDLIIPTYEMDEAEPLPIFHKLRVNQGSQGAFYPYKSNDKLTMTMNPDHSYRAIRLENDYIRVTVLPELGGRIYEGYDKINDYHFVYKNNVIKPALIGLNGAWISGGIEFNWPQHHRPSTFLALESTTSTEDDGSVTAWVGETEALNGLKCLLGINIHPDKAYITAKAKIYNPTTQKHSFHWWANLAVHVDDSYRLMFPPDIDYVTFHDRSHVSEFPIVKGPFASFNYYDGVDIRQYKNIDPACSFFIFDSQYSFMAGYNDNKQMGTVHVADKYISPGKKFFTWGQAGYAKEWQKNLTDEDGDYIEIMTGCYTDNQPDFSWIAPQETKTFEQRWYSLNGLEDLKNATPDGAISVVKKENHVVVQFNVTSPMQVSLDVNGKRTVYDATPGSVYEYIATHVAEVDQAFVNLANEDGTILVHWEKLPMYFDDKEVPTPREKPRLPQEIDSLDELYTNGMHLEQYKDATIDPSIYYMEILNRDSTDLRANTAMGTLLYRKGDFKGALSYIDRAIKSVTSRNSNPYDSDCYYQKGLILRQLGKHTDALPFLKRAAWQYAYKSAALLQCAEIEIMIGDYQAALEDLEIVLQTNYYALKARALKEALLVQLQQEKAALQSADETIRWDHLASGSYFTRVLCSIGNAPETLMGILRDKTSAYLDLAEIYLSAGLYSEAEGALTLCPRKTALYRCYIEYTRAQLSNTYVIDAQAIDSALQENIFPNRTLDFTILEYVSNHSASTFAPYYLGCMYFSRKYAAKAAICWELALKRSPEFADAYRAYAQLLFEDYGDSKNARTVLKKAFDLCPSPRILFEYYQLLKVSGSDQKTLLDLLVQHMAIVRNRQELLLEYVDLLIIYERYEEAADILDTTLFYTYEGGEGETPQRHAYAHIYIAKKVLAQGNTAHAYDEFIKAGEYPSHFQEGHRHQVGDAHRLYYTAMAHYIIDDMEHYRSYLELATAEFDSMSESQFYKGLAFHKLGFTTEAQSIFLTLKSEGDRLAQKEDMEYFLSFPTPFPYEQSKRRYMNKVGRIAGCLGRIGLGEYEAASEMIEALKKDGMPYIWTMLALSEVQD